MLTNPQQKGVTLIELLIGIALLSILLGLGVPAFMQMIENMQVRTQTENFKNGLLLARAEALKRNLRTSFSMVGDLSNSCTPTTNGPFWIVSREDTALSPDNNCHLEANPDPAANSFILHKSDANPNRTTIATTSPNAAASQICFNGLGQLTTLAGTGCVIAAYRINFRGPSGSTCFNEGGDTRCLSVEVQPGGEIRMCDPAVTTVGDSRRCLVP